MPSLPRGKIKKKKKNNAETKTNFKNSLSSYISARYSTGELPGPRSRSLCDTTGWVVALSPHPGVAGGHRTPCTLRPTAGTPLLLAELSVVAASLPAHLEALVWCCPSPASLLLPHLPPGRKGTGNHRGAGWGMLGSDPPRPHGPWWCCLHAACVSPSPGYSQASPG